jgi:hypothetical protein
MTFAVEGPETDHRFGWDLSKDNVVTLVDLRSLHGVPVAHIEAVWCFYSGCPFIVGFINRAVVFYRVLI